MSGIEFRLSRLEAQTAGREGRLWVVWRREGEDPDTAVSRAGLRPAPEDTVYVVGWQGPAGDAPERV